MGRYYQTVDSTKRSEDLYRQAIQLSERCNDHHTAYLAYDYLSRQIVWSNTQEALNLSLKSLEHYRQHPDKLENEMAILANVSTNYALCNDTVGAFKTLHEADSLAKNNDSAVLRLGASRQHTGVYLAFHNYHQALHHAKQGLSVSSEEEKLETKLQLAVCYIGCDSLEQAKQVLLSLLPSDNYLDKYSVYWELRDIALRQGDYKLASEYADSTIAAYRQLYISAMTSKDAYYHDVIEKERRNEQQKYEHQQARRTWMFVVAILALLVLLSFILTYYRIKLNSQKQLHALHQHKLEMESHINRELELQAILERQQEQAAKKETDYQQKMVAYLEMEIEKEKLQKQLTQGGSKEDVENMKNYILENSEFVKLVRGGMDVRKMNQELWSEIEDIINLFCHHLLVRIEKEHPNLQPSQKELCILNRLGLSKIEIAQFYHITPDAVKVRNRKLKREVFGITDPNISIQQILEELS